jgi:hypothetical protein
VVAGVDGRAVLAEHLALLLRPHVADHLVHVQPEVLDVQLRVVGVLRGDDQHLAAVPAYGGDRLGRTRHQRRRADRGPGVQAAVERDDLGYLLGRKPESRFVLQRWTEPAHRERAVDGDARASGHRVPHRGDAGAGVDQGHVQVETDDERIRGHPSTLRASGG